MTKEVSMSEFIEELTNRLLEKLAEKKLVDSEVLDIVKELREAVERLEKEMQELKEKMPDRDAIGEMWKTIDEIKNDVLYLKQKVDAISKSLYWHRQTVEKQSSNTNSRPYGTSNYTRGYRGSRTYRTYRGYGRR